MAIYAIYAILPTMAVFFPKEVWSQIIDYLPIHKHIHAKRLDKVLDDHLTCFEAMFDLLYSRSEFWRPEDPIEAKLEYLDDDCVAMSRETLPNTIFVPDSHAYLYEEVDTVAIDELEDPTTWVYDRESDTIYLPAGQGILELPYYRRAIPFDLWTKGVTSLYRMRWLEGYPDV